eukprot:5160300-Amphidinium_carterae.1
MNGVVSGPAAWRATFAAYCEELGSQAHRTSLYTFIIRETMWKSWSGEYFSTKGEAKQHDAKRPQDQQMAGWNDLCFGRGCSLRWKRTRIPERSPKVANKSQLWQVGALHKNNGREQRKTAFRALAVKTGAPKVHGDCGLLVGRVSTLTHADKLALNEMLMRAKETVAPMVHPFCKLQQMSDG